MGDAGANAADIFPRLSAAASEIDRVIVADFPKNKHNIVANQGAEYLRLHEDKTILHHGVRIARKAKAEGIDVIHVFYRQQNAALLIVIRLALILFWARATIVMDHRSVNLAKGWRARRKMTLNWVMQWFTHHLAGNPLAVETNHAMVTKPKHIIDLGYDRLPEGKAQPPENPREAVNVWFIGTLKPRNRKSWFLLDTFDRLARSPCNKRIIIRVAGPTTAAQAKRLRANPNVIYYGTLPRQELYQELRTHPGIGLAYMNQEYHGAAPSLKFAEYAIMRYFILAADTPGLQMQASRMGLNRVRFIAEDVKAWSNAIIEAAQAYRGLEPAWADAARWSYPAIYHRQVLALYRRLAGRPRWAMFEPLRARPPTDLSGEQKVGNVDLIHPRHGQDQNVA